MNKFEEFNFTDKDGNSTIAHSDGTIFLALASDSVKKKNRNIGKLVITPKNQRIHYKKSAKEENRFRKNDSWGLHWDIVSRLDDEAYIGVRSELGMYKIKAGLAKEYAEVVTMKFKQQGFELQRFVPIKYWEFERA